MFKRATQRWLALSLAVILLPLPGGAEDALTALQRSGSLGSQTPDAAGSKSLDGMGASASWGSADEKTPIPTSPRVAGLPFLQTLINEAPAGSVLKLAPGRYSGPAVLDKPLTIEGGGQAIIDGGGKGTVFALETNDAVLRGVHLTNSGYNPQYHKYEQRTCWKNC